MLRAYLPYVAKYILCDVMAARGLFALPSLCIVSIPPPPTFDVENF